MTADLIFFLECIAIKPELWEEFKEEYDDLFGFSGFEEPTLYYTATAIYENPSRRLMYSILQTYSMEFSQSTTTAAYIAQLAVYEKIRNSLDGELKWTDPEITRKVKDDFSYSVAWIKFFSRPVAPKTPFRRIIDSYNPVLEDAKPS